MYHIKKHVPVNEFLKMQKLNSSHLEILLAITQKNH